MPGRLQHKESVRLCHTPCAACGAFLPGAWVHTLHYRPSVLVIMVLRCRALQTHCRAWSALPSGRLQPNHVAAGPVVEDCSAVQWRPPASQGTHPCFTFLPPLARTLSCSHPRQVLLAIPVPMCARGSDASCTGLFPGLGTYRCLSGQILVLECLLSMQSLSCMCVALPLPAGHALSLHLNTFTSPSHQSIGIC